MRYLLLPALFVAACASDPPPGRILELQIVDVARDAIEGMEVAARLGSTVARFEMLPAASYEGVVTQVSPDGRYIMTLDAAYIASKATMRFDGQGRPNTVVDLEVYAVDAARDPTLTTIEFVATVIRRGERIADGRVFEPWPLTVGGRSNVTIRCTTPMFVQQCMNLEPL